MGCLDRRRAWKGLFCVPSPSRIPLGFLRGMKGTPTQVESSSSLRRGHQASKGVHWKGKKSARDRDTFALLWTSLRNNIHHVLMAHSVPTTTGRVLHVLFKFLPEPQVSLLLLGQFREEKAKAAERLRNCPELSQLVRGTAEAKPMKPVFTSTASARELALFLTPLPASPQHPARSAHRQGQA